MAESYLTLTVKSSAAPHWRKNRWIAGENQPNPSKRRVETRAKEYRRRNEHKFEGWDRCLSIVLSSGPKGAQRAWDMRLIFREDKKLLRFNKRIITIEYLSFGIITMGTSNYGNIHFITSSLIDDTRVNFRHLCLPRKTIQEAKWLSFSLTFHYDYRFRQSILERVNNKSF